MSDFDSDLRDEFITRVAEMVKADPEAAAREGFDEETREVLLNLTPERRAFLHAHFDEMFVFEPGAFEEMKRRLRPN